MYTEIFRKQYGETSEKFNDKIIYSKNNEDIILLMSEVCKSLEILKEIKFIKCTLNPMNKIYKNGNKENKIDIEESRLSKLQIEFQIKTEDEKVDIVKELYFPQLIDNSYFLINGTRFFPVFQLVDSETYRTKDSITLKTLLMPLIIRYTNSFLKDKNNKLDLISKTLKLDLFRSKIPVFQYYFAKMGVEKTIEYFDFPIEVNNAENKDDYIDCLEFQINKNISLFVDEEWFNEDIKQNSIIINSFIDSLEGRLSMERILSKDFWIKKLGSNFTKNNSNYFEKGNSILNSFERIFDETTKRVIRINEIYKKDSYSILKFIIINYNNLLKQDNMDLANKRLRLYEYLMYPLVRKFSKSIYRLLNQKNITMKSLKTIFSNIPQGFLIKSIVNNKLVRYMNEVNTIDLFSNILKGSISGPQSSGTGGNSEISDKLRILHPSMIRRIDLAATSSGEPGLSFTITPFCKITDDLHFTEEPNL